MIPTKITKNDLLTLAEQYDKDYYLVSHHYLQKQQDKFETDEFSPVDSLFELDTEIKDIRSDNIQEKISLWKDWIVYTMAIVLGATILIFDFGIADLFDIHFFMFSLINLFTLLCALLVFWAINIPKRIRIKYELNI